MHKRWYNHARLPILLQPRGPILIKSGLESPDPTRPSMEFVRTRHAELGETVYLPGSSLKGAVRHHAERLLRGMDRDVCDPFFDSSPCRSADIKNNTAEKVFSSQCPACRTFGSLKAAGRTHIFDAYPLPEEQVGEDASEEKRLTETRWQVGISRKSSRPSRGALFDLEIVTRGVFETEIQLSNFQLWQLALIAGVLRDIDAGLVPIGFGKSRGLGQVRVQKGTWTIESADGEDHLLRGAGDLTSETERKSYGLYGRDAILLPQDCKNKETWRGRSLSVSGDALEALLELLLEGPFREALPSMPSLVTAGGEA